MIATTTERPRTAQDLLNDLGVTQDRIRHHQAGLREEIDKSKALLRTLKEVLRGQPEGTALVGYDVGVRLVGGGVWIETFPVARGYDIPLPGEAPAEPARDALGVAVHPVACPCDECDGQRKAEDAWAAHQALVDPSESAGTRGEAEVRESIAAGADGLARLARDFVPGGQAETESPL